MGLTPLPPTQAYTPGADLWIIGHPHRSKWARNLNWHLNHLILRGFRHEPQTLTESQRHFLRERELALLSPSVERSFLLLPAEKHLPAKWVVSVKNWEAPALVQRWRELKEPTTRLFFDQDVNLEMFLSEWKNLTSRDDFQFVLD